MCGIWGWWNRNGEAAPSEELIRCATQPMANRGPDDFGFHRSPSGFAMGFRRLSIIDLETGHQPISNRAGSIVATLNGEIYNFRQLRDRLVGLGYEFSTRSDTEVIVHGYEQWGSEVFSHLCGMFAIALWDQRKEQLLLARDRLGIKPLYFLETPSVIGYASDPRTLLGMPGFSTSIDEEALALYLQYFYVPAPWTIYKGIRKLRPGEIRSFTRGSSEGRRFWCLHFEPEHRSPAACLDEFSALFHDVVAQHLIADVPIGGFLSGGMDSTAVLQAAAEACSGAFLSFNIAFEDREANEARYAREAATVLATAHRELNMESDPGEVVAEALAEFPEPFGDPAAAPNYLLSQITRRHCKAVLSGDGGDEVFGGYSLRTAQLLSLLQYTPRLFRRCGRSLPSVGGIFDLSLSDVANWYIRSHTRFPLDQIRRFIGGGGEPGPCLEAHTQQMRDELRRSEVKGLLNPILLLDLSFGLPDQMLTKVDVTSMAHGLEVRVPLLDHRIVEFAARLPESMKQWGFGRKRTKRIIRAYLGRRFSPSFINRPKQGFGMPFSGALRQRLEKIAQPEGVEELCLPPLFEERALREWIASADFTLSKLWGIVSLSLWYEQVGMKHLRARH